MPTPAELDHKADETTSKVSADRGEKARTRLLEEAKRIFAEKGFAKASTREICTAAGLNAAAISYHFGGKEELYRAVLMEPLNHIVGQLNGVDPSQLSLSEAMVLILTPFLMGAATDQSTLRLHLREMVEPSPVYAQAIGQTIKPQHDMIARLLARHMGLPRPDDDVHRLVFGILAMTHDYCMSQEFMKIISPSLLDAPDALHRARDRIVDWTVALVNHERQRRRLNSPVLNP